MSEGLEPKNQIINTLNKELHDVYYAIFVFRHETEAMPALLGLIYTIAEKGQTMLKDEEKKLLDFMESGKAKATDIWLLYKAIATVMNKLYFNEVMFGIVPASAVVGDEARPNAKKYGTVVSDDI